MITESAKQAMEAFAVRSREVLWDAAARSEALAWEGNTEGAALIMREAQEKLLEEVKEIVIREAFLKPSVEKALEMLGLQGSKAGRTNRL